MPPDAAAPFAGAVFTASTGARLPYRLLPPAAPAPGRRYPLVLQLHGSSAIGTDNLAQIGSFALTWAAPAARERFPAYVLVPQAPSRTAAYHGEAGAGRGPVSRALPPLAATLELVDSLRRALPVDSTRVYLLGFSMGGSAVWHALRLRPATFAAAVAIASVPPDSASALSLPRVPLLLLHGTADTENPYAGARAAYATLRAAGRGHVEFHTYPGLGHAIAPDVLTGHWWREWMFGQRR